MCHSDLENLFRSEIDQFGVAQEPPELFFADREIRLTMVETGEELATLPTDRLLTTLAFSPGGDRLVAVLEPGYFQLWNLRQLRKDLAAMNLDWPDVPLPPDRSATGKLRITVVLESSKPVNSLPRQPASR